jgi:hypothetical protein
MKSDFDLSLYKAIDGIGSDRLSIESTVRSHHEAVVLRTTMSCKVSPEHAPETRQQAEFDANAGMNQIVSLVLRGTPEVQEIRCIERTLQRDRAIHARRG